MLGWAGFSPANLYGFANAGAHGGRVAFHQQLYDFANGVGAHGRAPLRYGRTTSFERIYLFNGRELL